MPFKSKAQHKLFRVLESKGKLAKGTSSTWMKHTDNYKKLPEHVKKAATGEYEPQQPPNYRQALGTVNTCGNCMHYVAGSSTCNRFDFPVSNLFTCDAWEQSKVKNNNLRIDTGALPDAPTMDAFSFSSGPDGANMPDAPKLDIKTASVDSVLLNRIKEKKEKTPWYKNPYVLAAAGVPVGVLLANFGRAGYEEIKKVMQPTVHPPIESYLPPLDKQGAAAPAPSTGNSLPGQVKPLSGIGFGGTGQKPQTLGLNNNGGSNSIAPGLPVGNIVQWLNEQAKQQMAQRQQPQQMGQAGLPKPIQPQQPQQPQQPAQPQQPMR